MAQCCIMNTQQMSSFIIIQAGVFPQLLFTDNLQSSDKNLVPFIIQIPTMFNCSQKTALLPGILMKTCLRVNHKRCYAVKIVYFPTVVFALPSNPLCSTYSLFFLFISLLYQFYFFLLIYYHSETFWTRSFMRSGIFSLRSFCWFSLFYSLVHLKRCLINVFGITNKSKGGLITQAEDKIGVQFKN